MYSNASKFQKTICSILRRLINQTWVSSEDFRKSALLKYLESHLSSLLRFLWGGFCVTEGGMSANETSSGKETEFG